MKTFFCLGLMFALLGLVFSLRVGVLPVQAEEVSRAKVGCTFNQDCASDQRCACTEESGCACENGPRGKGRAGVDPCTRDLDCEFGLCVEGPEVRRQYFCSGECRSDQDCGPELPVCAAIARLGNVCIRKAW